MSKHLLSAQAIGNSAETVTQHQFNDRAVRHARALSRPAGLQRLGVHLVRLEPGHDSTTHHYHDADEEFLYVLSGRGKARIGDEEFDIGPGDFMGFPAPSPPHSMSNPYAEDLVYLMGGESNPLDVVHYPEQSRSMVKSAGRRYWALWQDLHDLPPRP